MKNLSMKKLFVKRLDNLNNFNYTMNVIIFSISVKLSLGFYNLFFEICNLFLAKFVISFTIKMNFSYVIQCYHNFLLICHSFQILVICPVAELANE